MSARAVCVTTTVQTRWDHLSAPVWLSMPWTVMESAALVMSHKYWQSVLMLNWRYSSIIEPRNIFKC